MGTIIKRRHAREQKEMKENGPEQTYLWRAVRYGQFCQVICRQQKVGRSFTVTEREHLQRTNNKTCLWKKQKRRKEEKTREMHHVRKMMPAGFETTRFDKRAAQSASPRLVPWAKMATVKTRWRTLAHTPWRTTWFLRKRKKEQQNAQRKTSLAKRAL